MSRAKRYLAPMARLTIFIVTCAAVLLYIDYRVARASVMERLLGIGQRMAPFMDDARGTEPPRQMHVNGVRMWVAAGKTDRPPTEVRRWYAERYAGPGTAMGVITDGLNQALKAEHIMPPPMDGTTQASFGDDNVGGMAAIDVGDHQTMRSLKPIILKLAAGKIGEVGHLRYLYFEKLPNGGTRYLTVWTDDTFDLAKFLPGSQSDDAPGRDIEGVPRYPGSVRILAADERGRAAQMAVYNGQGSPETATMFYDARMATLGWHQDPQFADYARDHGMRSMRFLNDKGHEVVVDLAADERHGQGLTVTVIQMH